MAISAISRDWGPNNSIVRITCNDTFATITAAGYLNAQAFYISEINNGAFEWSSDDACLIQYANGYGFFTPDFTVNFDFSPLPGNPLVGNYVRLPISLATFKLLYGTPLLVIPAVASSVIFVQNWALEWLYGSAALTSGGAIGLQYNNTDHAGGIAASNTIAAADLTGLSASGVEYSAGGVLAINSLINVINTGIYISNGTADFATGTGGSAILHVWYSTVIA